MRRLRCPLNAVEPRGAFHCAPRAASGPRERSDSDRGAGRAAGLSRAAHIPHTSYISLSCGSPASVATWRPYALPEWASSSRSSQRERKRTGAWWASQRSIMPWVPAAPRRRRRRRRRRRQALAHHPVLLPRPAARNAGSAAEAEGHGMAAASSAGCGTCVARQCRHRRLGWPRQLQPHRRRRSAHYMQRRKCIRQSSHNKRSGGSAGSCTRQAGAQAKGGGCRLAPQRHCGASGVSSQGQKDSGVSGA